MEGFSLMSRVASVESASAMSNSLKVMLVRSASSSSGLAGKEMPPKSVKCVVLQNIRPAGAFGGGGTSSRPSETHIEVTLSKYRHASATEQLLPVKPG